MGLADDIISGNYNPKKRKLADDIIKGTYKPTSVLDDIAPVKTTVTQPVEEKKDTGIFSKGAFSDGYQVGDVTKSILGTGLDVVTNLAKSWFGLGETAGDLINYGIAGIAHTLGAKDFAANLTEDTNKSLTNEIFAPAENLYDKTSLLGEFSDNVVQGIGYYAGLLSLQQFGVPWQVTSGVSSGGSEMSEAFSNGATVEEALASSVLSAGAEIGSEYLFGGLKLPGTGKTSEAIFGGMVDNIKNKALKSLAGFGINVVGEGLEEIISGWANNVAKNLTYMKDDEKEFLGSAFLGNLIDGTTSYFSQNAWNDFIMGELVTALTNGGGSLVTKKGRSQIKSDIQSGRNLITGYTTNEQSIIDQEVSNKMAEAEKNGKKLTNKEKSTIKEQVEEDLKRGYISTDTIESTLGGDTYNQLQELKNKKQSIQDEITKLENMPNAEITVAENEKLQDLRNQIKEIDTKELETKLSDEVKAKIGNDNFLKQSYIERALKSEKFSYDTSKVTDENAKATYESAARVANNSNRSHEFVDKVAKLAADRGTKYLFTNNEEIANGKYNIKGKTINGFIDENGNVLININSDKTLNTILGHETTHLLEGTKEYKELQEAAIEFAKMKNDYQNRVDSLNELYKNVENADINNELTADIIGDYLFTDENFINNLSTKKPTLFTKIKNLIDDLVVRFKGTKEERQLRELQRKFEKAYRQNKTQENSDGVVIDTINDALWKLQGKKDEYIGIANGFPTVDSIKKQFEDTNKERTEYINNLLNTFSKQETNNSGEMINNLNADENIKYSLNENNQDILNNIENNKKIEYNKDTNLNKYKSSVLFDQMMMKYKPNIDEPVIINDYENTYVAHKYSNNDYDIKFKINNDEYNENKKYYKELIEYVKRRETIANNVSFDNNGYRSNNNDNVISEKKQTWVQFADRILEQYQREESAKNNEQSNGNNGELENSSFSLSEQLEQQGTKILEEAENKRQAMIENFKEYLEENSITKPTQQDIDDSITDLLSYDNEQSAADNAKDEKLYNQYVREYMKENNIPFKDTKYSLSVKEANTTQDNQGNNLSKEQIAYFENSKAVDENGNLIIVYHTTTDPTIQFNEFNPVGTDYYKFGDQVVNYFTDDKNMSGSYADQDYEMADTKKITSLKEAEELVKQMNEQSEYDDTIKIEKKGNGYQLVNNIYKDAYEYAKSVWENEITPEEKQIEKDYEKLYKRYVESGYDNNLVPEFTSLEKYAKEYSDKLDEIRRNMTPEERDAFLSFRNPDFVSVITEPVIIAEYANEENLFRNLKQDIQKADDKKNKLQYEGYVNITNPYVIDAEGRNWNKIESKEDSPTTSKMIYLDTLTKDRLIQLAKDSKNIYDENYSNYRKYLDATNSINGNLREENSLEIRNANRIFEEVFYDGVNAFINNEYKSPLDNGTDESLNSLYEYRTNSDIMRKMSDWDLVSPSEYENYEKTLEVSDDIRERLKKIVNEKAKYNEYDNDGRNPVIKEDSLINIWKQFQDYSKKYSNTGRYEYSTFDNQLLDGYLKNELEAFFPVRDEFGINEEYLKDLYKVASHDFNEDYIRGEYNDWSVTNDIVKKIIELNKYGENYDGVIMRNVVDYGGKSDSHEAHDLYITFNSNQFKNIDNTTPTNDDDIRYSLSNNNDIAPIGNYNVYGKDIKYQVEDAIAPLQETIYDLSNQVKQLQNDIAPVRNEVENNVPKEKTERDIIAERILNDKVKKAIQNQSYKAVNMAAKKGQEFLNFDQAEKKQFKNELSKYIGKTREEIISAATWNDVKDIVSNYTNREIKYVDEELKSIKDEIRKRRIKVTDNLKNQITDYNDFRRSNFGKLKLGSEGNNIDSLYQELSNSYPYYFGEANTEADMLYELSDFMNQDITVTDKYKLTDEDIEDYTNKIFNLLKDNTMSSETIEELQNKLEKKINTRTREVIQQELLDDMGVTLDDIAQGKDISALDSFRTDPIRLNEKVFGYETGNKINDATIRKTKHNEAERIRWLNKERQEIKDLGIKAFSKESAAVQKYAEKEYVNDQGEVVPYGDMNLMREFKNAETREKIKHAAEVLRGKYDTYIDQINKTLTDMGYTPIAKRKDYMRHFQALNDIFSRFGTPLNKESMQSDALPTDINGLTDQFKPGKQYFANALKRLGMKTQYDAITGIDGYLDGASNLIYHTEDIQRYRALSKLIRNTYGQTHGFDDFANMTPEQQAERVEDIQSNKLSKYAAWLDEQANALAGKKGGIDRAAERILGRKIYNVLNTAKKQVGSNMTGYNVRSALTNFASAVQGASKTNKLAFIKGTLSTMNNIINHDGLIDKSDFLTSRFGSENLSQKLWQRLSNKGQIFMSGTDYFTANQIWRSKYFENLQKGMTETDAIKNADDFAARIMGDRSKGSTAEAFNSKTLGLLTQFQLEVNNQWSSLIHDNKIDVQNKNKTMSSMLFQTGQLFALSYLFNNFMKSLTGSKVMIDPVDLFKKIFAPDDDDERTIEERAREAFGDIIDDLPFVSFFTGGGRIPVSEAFQGANSFLDYLTGQNNSYGQPVTFDDAVDDTIESAFYWLLPTGYGQAKKTVGGLSMFDENLPVKGSYTDSGRLRYPVEDTPTNRIQAGLFGKWANKNAQDYLNRKESALTEKQIDEFSKLDMPIQEYWDYSKGLKEARAEGKENGNQTEAIFEYINSLDATNEQKNIMINSNTNRKKEIDMSNYDDYGSYEEFDFATKNEEKYNYLEKNNISYKEYTSSDETKKAYDYAYNNRNKKDFNTKMTNYVNKLNLTSKDKKKILSKFGIKS